MTEALRKGIASDEFINQPFLQTSAQPDLLPHAQGKFHTPSGKFEFYCAKMARDSLDPLPTFVPPHETLGNGPYPLNFLPRKHKDSLNSSYGHLPVVRRQEHEARTLEMHSRDASARGLSDGEEVRIFHARGTCRCLFVKPGLPG